MTPNADLFARYPDLLGGDTDAELLRVVGDLDALYTSAEPPAALPAQVEQALAVRAEHGQTSAKLMAVSAQPSTRQLSPRWWQTLTATAAAFTVVALMAVLLTSLGRGPGGGGETPDQRFARLGGIRIVAIADCLDQAGNCGSPASLQREVSIIQARIGATLNMPEVIVRLQGDASILIELPGVKDDAQVLALLEQGCVDVIATGGTEVPVGTDVRQSRVTYLPLITCGSVDSRSVAAQKDPQSGQPVVTLTFTGADQASLANYTSTHLGKYLTFALDGRAIESAAVQSAITGAIQIIGWPNLGVAQTIATLVRFGPLPTPLKIHYEQVVPPGGPQACAPPTPTAIASRPTPTLTPPPTPTPTATPTPGSGAKIRSAPSDVGCPTPTPGAQPTPTWTPSGTIMVPDVFGLPVAQALNVLTAANLRKVIIVNQPSTLPAGYVFRTDPPAGTHVVPAQPIVVYVSTGAGTPTPSPTAWR